MENTVLSAILQESLLLLLIISSIFALLLGLLLLVSPQQAQALSQRYNHWVSLRQPTKPLEIPRNADHYLYRQHRATGLFILLSSGYILYHFAFNYDQAATIQALNSLFDHAIIIEWLLEATLWFILPISGLLLLFGATMAIKPSALKGIETFANHWVSTRKTLQPIEKQNKSMDTLVNHYPRLFGIFLVLVAGYNLIILLIFFINNVY